MESGQLSPSCFFHTFILSQVTLCKFRSLPHRAKENVINLLSTFGEVAALRHHNEVPLVPREGSAEWSSRRANGQVLRRQKDGAALKNVALFNIIAVDDAEPR